MPSVAPYLLIFVSLLLAPPSAQAYLGPVLGLGVIGSVLAVVVVGLLSLFSFVYLPLRNFLRRNRRHRDDEPEPPE